MSHGQKLIQANFQINANKTAAQPSVGSSSARSDLAANEFPGTASEVIEVVATGEFALPTNVEMSFDLGLTWKPLQSTG